MPPIRWKPVTVVELVQETPRARTLVLDVEGWPGHRAGQHVDVRLTAEDGYQAERSYSIASAPEDERLAITVDRLEDGEVSSYLAGDLVVGDRFELRGPIGGYLVWTVEDGPVFLVAGGSGVVPLMAMLRHHRARAAAVDVTVLVSARTADMVFYRAELGRLGAGAGVTISYTLTREQPPGWTGYARRVDRAMLEELAGSAGFGERRAFVCGPTAFVESVADLLTASGMPGDRVHTERFGPTGAG
jgi:ferredoxin-NADP reductase